MLRGAGCVGQAVGESDGDAAAPAVDRRAGVAARLITASILAWDTGCPRVRSVLVGMDEKRNNRENDNPFGDAQLCFLVSSDVSIP